MSATSSWSSRGEALAIDVLHRAGRVQLRVRGESMLPSLWPGDVAEIKAGSVTDAGPGDIVLAMRDGRFFLHRLVVACDGGFVARGDSMPSADPKYSSDALLGKLVRIVRAGKVVVPRRLRAWSRIVGLVCCYCRWARQLVLRFHRADTLLTDGHSVCDLTTDVCNREAQ